MLENARSNPGKLFEVQRAIAEDSLVACWHRCHQGPSHKEHLQHEQRSR